MGSLQCANVVGPVAAHERHPARRSQQSQDQLLLVWGCPRKNLAPQFFVPHSFPCEVQDSPIVACQFALAGCLHIALYVCEYLRPGLLHVRVSHMHCTAHLPPLAVPIPSPDLWLSLPSLLSPAPIYPPFQSCIPVGICTAFQRKYILYCGFCTGFERADPSIR